MFNWLATEFLRTESLAPPSQLQRTTPPAPRGGLGITGPPPPPHHLLTPAKGRPPWGAADSLLNFGRKGERNLRLPPRHLDPVHSGFSYDLVSAPHRHPTWRLRSLRGLLKGTEREKRRGQGSAAAGAGPPALEREGRCCGDGLRHINLFSPPAREKRTRQSGTEAFYWSAQRD